jgi:LPXTG-motif cell wall-anchored protein
MKRTFSILATVLVLGTAGLASAQTGTTDANNQITQTNDPNANPNTTTDNPNNTDENMNTTTSDGYRSDLPATATPLPLAMMAGAGLVALGFWMRRRRR